VFIDPPYEIIPQAARVLFAHLAVALAAKPDALVLLELPGGLSLAPEGWAELKRLGKGTHQPTVAVFHRR
jgi:16S rRNA G966 N2-methylase RsmD